jgi:hypothetical protein
MQRLIPLDAPEAGDSQIVGAKAARLSRAMSEGLPVLGGWVLPVAASSIPLRLGGAVLEEHGPAAATMAVSRTTLDAALSRDLAAIEHPTARRSIVRSSTTFDDDRRWAGAFATYHDVERTLLPVAVRGCWASAFSSDVFGRSRALHRELGEIGIGVVVQPWLTFAFGGTARWHPDGRVELTVAEGGPAGIVGGAAGTTIEVDPGLTFTVGGGTFDTLNGTVTGSGNLTLSSTTATLGSVLEVAALSANSKTGAGRAAVKRGPYSSGTIRITCALPVLTASRAACSDRDSNLICTRCDSR